MKFIIFAIGILIIFLVYNAYKFKRIIRRSSIKKMQVDDYINELIEDFKKEVNNNSEIKSIHNQMRIIIFFKSLIYLSFFFIAMLSPIIYCLYIIVLKGEIISIYEVTKMNGIYWISVIISIIAIFFIEMYRIKKYQKNKEKLKDYIYNNFVSRIRFDMKWYSKQSYIGAIKIVSILDNVINLDEKYRKASFNKIQVYEEKYEDITFSEFSNLKRTSFEDYMGGIYKEKYILLISDFKEDIKNRKDSLRVSEGVFCIIKIDKKIVNDIKITSNKKHSFFMDKQYMVTTMPEEFNKKFIILAKDGYKLSEKISKKSIEILEEFYNNSKMNFDISIKDDEIFFRFKTIDTMELNICGDIIDALMLKEYANIILFITRLAEEINDNWKVV